MGNRDIFYGADKLNNYINKIYTLILERRNKKDMRLYEILDILTLTTRFHILDKDIDIAMTKNEMLHIIYERFYMRSVLSLYVDNNELYIVLEDK